MKYSITLIFTLLTGCVSSGVIPSGPDTYMVSASGAGFATAGVRETVYEKANEFCKERGLVMVPVSFKAREGEFGRRPPSADLIFRALKPGDPAIDRPDIIESDESIVINKNIKLSEEEQNSYGQLIKLDELRKRGILSEEEFQAEKKKILKQ